MTRVEQAKAYFQQGYACSQAVALAFADLTGIGERELAQIMLPFGGHKGYGLAMMVEMLSGVLAGAGMLSGVNSWNTVPGRDADTGHFFMTINPAFFGGLDNFTSRMESVITELISAPKAEGVAKIYYPGELEFISEAKAIANGIDLPDASAAELDRASKVLSGK